MDGGELADQVQLGLGGWMEMFKICPQFGVIFFSGFVLQDDGLRGESVSEAVQRRGALAFFGGWAPGQSAVGARGFEHTVRGRHR